MSEEKKTPTACEEVQSQQVEGAGENDQDCSFCVAEGSSASNESTEQQEPIPASEETGMQQEPAYYPFLIKSDGVYFLEEKDGEFKETWLCSPLAIAAMTRDASGQAWGRIIKVTDPDDNVHVWVMPMSMTAGSGDEYRAHLKALGLRLAPGQQGRNRLDLYLNLTQPSGRARCVSRIGWHGDRFILPDEEFGHHEGEEVLLQATHVENSFQTAGDLREWQDRVGQYCIGNSRLILSVSAALTGPVLFLVDEESGGIHLVGGSSLGKTTALFTAGSVCGGGGVTGFVKSWRSTDNGLEALATNHCDTFLCLDEMGQVSAKGAAESAYMLGNGKGKVRAKQNGGGRKVQEWRTFFLSTGEITLADKIREDGKGRVMAGQLMRVVDVPADAGVGLGIFEHLHGHKDGDAFARHLKAASLRYYGTPLRAFLRDLVQGKEEAQEAIKACINDFKEENTPEMADGQVKRVCARFALIAAAGELAVSYGIFPWHPGNATLAAAQCFRAWLENRGGAGPTEIMEGIKQVRAFFQMHGSSRFEVLNDAATDPKVPNRAGFKRKDDLGTWEFLVFPEVFRNEVCKGFDSKRLAKELIARKILLPDSQGKSSRVFRVPGLTERARYYHFSALVLSSSEHEN